MRFKTDENLHPELAEFLRENGHDAITVWEQGLRGRSDSDLAGACQSEHRALVTLDVGFADIRVYPPRQFAGLIVLRVTNQSRRNILRVFPRILSLLKSEPLAGQLWIVDDYGVRVREDQADAYNQAGEASASALSSPSIACKWRRPDLEARRALPTAFCLLPSSR